MPSSSQRSPRPRGGLLLALITLATGFTCWSAPSLAAASELPEVTIRVAAAVTKTSATIEAGINPKGSETSWEIWLECQNAAREKSPCEPLTVGRQLRQGVLAPGVESHTVTDEVTGLQPGYMYTYAVVATNAAGKEGYVNNGILTCPSTGPCSPQPWLAGESLWNLEGARRAAEEAPRLEAEREAKKREAEERPAKEAAERAAREREVREAGERAGREAAERAAAPKLPRCVVPRLNGDSLAAARRALAKAHCSLGKVTRPRTHLGALVVGKQSVRSGRKLATGAKVAVTLRPRRR